MLFFICMYDVLRSNGPFCNLSYYTDVLSSNSGGSINDLQTLIQIRLKIVFAVNPSVAHPIATNFTHATAATCNIRQTF